MIVDVHGHVGRFGSAESTAAGLDAWAAAREIDCVLVSSITGAAHSGQTAAQEEVDANVACLEACRPFTRLLPLYWVRPGQRDSNVHALAGALACEPFAGAVFSPVWNEFPADAAMLDAYIGVLTRLGLPAFIHTARDERAAPERIYSLARRHPGAQFVLYDALADAHRDDAIRVAQRCAQRGDVRVLLDTANADAAAVVSAINKAGSESVIYGSDACLWSAGAARDVARAEPAALRELLSREAFERVTAGNALALINATSAAAGAV